MKKIVILFLSLVATILIASVVYSHHSETKKDYSAIAIELSSTRVFAVNDDKDGVDVVDLTANKVLQTILRHKNIEVIAVDEQRKILAAAGERKLHIVSTETFEIQQSIRIQEDPVSLTLSSDLGLAILTHKHGLISIIDLNTNSVLKEIRVEKKPVSAAIDPALKLAVIAHHSRAEAEEGHQDHGRHHLRQKDNVTIVDLTTFVVVKTLDAGNKPEHVSVNTTTHQAVVVNEKSNDLTVIDLNTLGVTATIPLPKHPKASSINECLNTISIIGGQEKGPWFMLLDMATWSTKASSTFNREQNDIAVYPSLNKAIMAGKGGLTIVNLPNPVPVLTSVSPATAQRNGATFNAELSGTGLLATTAVYLNGNTADSSFQSCGNIQVAIPDTLIQQGGAVEIKAVNPTPEGGTSNLLYLNIVNPIPTITTLQPNQALAGSAELSLAVNGWGFFSDTILSVNTSTRLFTLISEGQLRTALTSTDLSTGGYLSIAATNPPPGGGTSTAVQFAILNPAPTLASVSPTSIIAGADASLTITGDNFGKSSQVMFNNQAVATSFTNKNSLQATIPAAFLANAGTYTVQVVNPAPGGGQTATTTVTVTPQSNPNVQPLPEGSFGKQYSRLIPMDATISAYDPKRFAIVTGFVNDRSQGPISGVTVSLLGLPQYGTAQTDATGRFNLPVDGGGVVTVVYQKQGYITSHRQANTPWNDIINTDTVTLLTEDTKATIINFDGNPNTVLTHTSTPITDSRGTRSLTMVFTGDNRATVTDANGQQSVKTTITTRATEFDTPASMPAKLPPTSAFTYCSELSVDGAKNVKFDKPVTMYVDNFLGFKVGEIVPVGYYDRVRGVWVGSDNGEVVKLLDTNGDGIVDALDTVGDNQPHETNVTGLTDPTKFKPGSTYWRVKVDHFSPWDHNWPFAPPLDATAPNPIGPPVPDQQPKCPPSDPCCPGSSSDKNASSCERRSRIMHEDVPIPGADMTLHYASNRVQGYKTIITIPASGNTVPASLKKIIVRMAVAGRVISTVLPPLPNQKAELTWDGLDHLGKPVVGATTANISIGFGYNLVYYSPSSFYQAWERVSSIPTSIVSLEEVVLWKYSTLSLPNRGSSSLAEGWTFSAHHFLNPSAPNTLIKGNGTTSEYDANIITTIAGNGQSGWSADGGPAIYTVVNQPYGVAADSAGNIYIADASARRIRKVDTSGIITTVAGNGYLNGPLGDGGPAVQASLTQPYGVAVDSKGNIYIADSSGSRIRKVDAAGIITTVAGIGTWGFSGDEGPAVRAKLAQPNSVAVDNSGNVYIADLGNSRVRKVDSSGVITTIAGNGQFAYSGDGGPATQASVNQPYAVAADNAGNVYIADRTNYRIRKVDTSGIITTVAGNGQYLASSGDGGPAVLARLGDARSIAVDSVGNIYIGIMGSSQIRKIDTNGIITTVAGNGTIVYNGDGGTATKASLYFPTGVALDSAGNMYIADMGHYRVRKVSTPSLTAFTQYGATGDIFFSEENSQGHIFSSMGPHKSTIDLATGKTLLTFGYDTNNQLISVTDRFGNQTTIQRSGNGTPVSITSPDGQVTSLVVDGNNHLTQVAYQDGSHYTFDYTNDGLLTNEYDRRNSHFVHNYDANGRITSVSDPEGGSWIYSRTTDYAGNITASVRTGEGNTITYQDHTDSTGAYTSVKTEPTGEVTTINRTSDELTETVASSCGMNQSLKYGLDSQYKFKYLSGSTTTSPAGLKLTSVFQKTYQDSNADNKPDVITDLMSQNTRTWTTINNSQTGAITSTSPAGRTITSSYDPTTLLTQQITVPGLTPTQFGYDTRGRLASTVTGSRTTTISYDANGYPNTLVTPDNKTYTYTNDVMGRLRTVLQPGGTTINYNYDANGNMTVLTNPNSITNGFDYTANNQRKTWTMPLSGNYQYTYDKERKLKSVIFPSGKIISNTYTHGLLTNTTTPEGITNYTYGCGSNLASATRGSESIAFTYDGTLLKSDTRTGTLNQEIGYVYNNDFKISSLTYAGATQSLGYDNDGLLTTAGAFTITRSAQNGLPERVGDGTATINRSFSGYGEMNQNTYAIGGNVLYQWNVIRDLAGRITRRTETVQGADIVWDYAYDELGRLKEVKKDDVVVEGYGYDADGNRTSEDNVLRGISGKVYTHSTEDHLITAGTDTYRFDKDGFLTERTTGEGTTLFHYSSRGELLSATLSNGTEISYEHDPFGRRIAKRVNGTVTEKYLWQGLIQLLAVYDGSDNIKYRFAYADDGIPTSMTYAGSTYYLFYDQVGSLKVVADTTGNIVKQTDYDTFGNIISDSNPNFSAPFGFAGGLYDSDTGLVRFGARDYDPVIGRWLAKDPIDFDGEDTNLFNYVGADPVNWIDPEGLQPGAAVLSPSVIAPLLPLLVPVAILSPPIAITTIAVGLVLALPSSIAEDPPMEGPICKNKDSAEHTKGARPSTKGKHEKGQSRKKGDKRGGEKGDVRRPY